MAASTKNHQTGSKLVLALLSASFLGGCSVHNIKTEPNPLAQIIKSFNAHDKGELAVQAGAEKMPWWQDFGRADLDQMIEEALAANQDVAQSIARLAQARAVAAQSGVQNRPMLNFEGSASQDWEGSDRQRGTAELGASLSWEIDLFNRVGATAKADRFRINARAADVQASRLSLSGAVADAYFGATAAHLRLKLLESQLQLDRDLLKLLTLRLENGVGTSVDVLQQKARVADAETLIPRAESDLAIFENRLDVLLGQTPDGQYRVAKDETLVFEATLPHTGVPLDLLMKRPDLRAARAELVAADADIGAAIADRFPRITLDGSYAFSDAASYTGPVSMIMGAFIQPLLDWGQRKAEVERNQALYMEKLAAFTQRFLIAVEEVENALYSEGKQREYLARLRNQRDILRETVASSEDRYTQGVDDYFPVINALQELRNVERLLIDEELRLISLRIDLHQSLGGALGESGEGDSGSVDNGSGEAP